MDDVKWDLSWFEKIHVRMGKGARGSGPRERMVSLINNSRARLAWFVQDVWGHFDDDHTRAGVPLLPSERKNPDGTCTRVGDEALRAASRPRLTRRTGGEPVDPAPAAAFPHQPPVYEAGVPLPYIRDILGHVDLSTTEINARASTEAKR